MTEVTADAWTAFVDSMMGDTLPAATKRTVKRETAKLAPNAFATLAVADRPAPAVVRETRLTAKEEFLRDEADLIAVIRKAATWSDFARSLTEAADHNRFPWSDRQIAAARSMAAKIAANDDKRAVTAAAPKAQADLSRVRAMFATATASGLGKPVFRAEGLTLSLAPATGKNPGAIYVKRGDDYAGKVVGTEFTACAGFEGVHAALMAVAADPMASAIRHGQMTGRCSCCGRTLTNTLSVELGIGPICRGHWGI